MKPIKPQTIWTNLIVCDRKPTLADVTSF